jgi:hypothetical protein
VQCILPLQAVSEREWVRFSASLELQLKLEAANADVAAHLRQFRPLPLQLEVEVIYQISYMLNIH